MSEAIGDASIVITANGDQAKDEIDDVAKKRTIPFDFNLRGLLPASRRIGFAARNRFVQFFVRINPKSMRIAKMQLEALSRLSGFRVLKDLGKGFKEFALNLDRTAPLIAAITAGIGGLTSVLGSSVGWIATVINQLGTLGGLALPLPAMFIGAGAALGVFIAAMKDAKTELEGVGSQFERLQDMISENFWEEAAVPIRDMVDDLMPMMTRQLGGLATSLGAFTGEAARATAMPVNVKQLESVFAATTRGTDAAKAGIDNWINAILGLAGAGSTYLPQVGDWFADMGVQFDEWQRKNVANGNFFTWVEDGMTTMGTLKDMVWDLFGALSGIGDASERAGGGGIFTWAAGLERLHTAIDSVTGQTALARFFEASKKGTDSILDGLGGLGNGVADAMPAIENVMVYGSDAIGSALSGIGDVFKDPTLQEGLSALAVGASLGMNDLAKAAGPIGKILGSVGKVAGALVEVLGPVLGKALEALAPLFEVLGDALGPIISILGDTLGKVIEVVAPLISQLAEGLGPVLQDVTVFLGDVADKAMPLIEAIGGLLGAALDVVMPVLQHVAEAILPRLSEAFGHVVDALQPVISLITGLIQEHGPLLITVLTWLADFIGGSLVGIIEGIADVIGGVFDVITGIADTFIGLFTGDWERFNEGIGKIFSGAWEAIVGALNIFLNIGIFKAIGKVFGGIKVFFTGFWSGLKGSFDTALGGLKGLWDNIWGAMSKAVSKVFTGMKANIKKIWDGIVSVVSKPINAVIGFINKGLIGAYNWVAGKLGLKSLGLIPAMAVAVSAGGGRGNTGGATTNTGFAQGGFVNLPWSAANRDPYLGMTPKGPFRFEGEEFFVKRASTKRLEQRYPGFLDHINRFGDIPGHAEGGRVTLRGHRLTAVFAAAIQAAEAALNKTFRITQGGFRPSTSYSGTSHQGDAVDIARPYGATDVAALRARGIAAWDRAGKGNWIDHIHGVPLPGYGSAAGSAVWQAQDYLKGGDGLGGRDNGPRGGAIQGFLAGIAGALKAGFDSVAGWFSGILDMITGPLNEFTSNLSGGIIGDLAKGVGNQLKDGLTGWIQEKLGLGQGYFNGTSSATPGWHMIGENGPELVNFRGREQVLSTSQSRRALASTSVVIHNLSLPGITEWAQVLELLQEKAAEKRNNYMIGANYGYSG